MKYRRATILADDWHGEFGSYDEWARLGPQPLLGHGTIGHFHCGIVGKGLSHENIPRPTRHHREDQYLLSLTANSRSLLFSQILH